MHSGTRRFENFYWSWRRYLKASLPNERIFYNPTDQPKPGSIDKWVIYLTGHAQPGRWMESVPRLMCVAKNNDDDSDLMDLVSDVHAIVDNTGSRRAYVPFYDQPSATIIGDIDIIKSTIGPTVPYDTGIDSISIDVFTRIKTDRIL